MATPESPDLNLFHPHFLSIQKPIVLVADDDVMIRNLVTLLMQGEGYVVLSSSDGQEGLELSRKYPGTIDLLITDMEMPRLNGMDLCSRLLQERPGIRVILMSAGDISEIVSKNVNLPFLPKPLDGAALIARVRAVLGAPVYEQTQAPNKP